MFSKGSRYRNLAESVFLNAQGERFKGKLLRRLPRTSDQAASRAFENRFQHRVLANDRLDLLAYKYYGDTTRWWLIGDGNPEWPFPIDLLDGRPMVEETFLLTHVDFQTRFFDLLVDLRSIHDELNSGKSFFDINPPFDAAAGFLEETVFLIYPPAKRSDVLTAIQAKGFHRLRSFGFPQGTLSAESFTVEDRAAKQDWRDLLETLGQTPGVVEIQSELTEAKMEIIYNSAMIAREVVLNSIAARGFDFEAFPYSRVSRKIRIPPNQFV